VIDVDRVGAHGRPKRRVWNFPPPEYGGPEHQVGTVNQRCPICDRRVAVVRARALAPNGPYVIWHRGAEHLEREWMWEE
jgi:hypothetical protein